MTHRFVTTFRIFVLTCVLLAAFGMRAQADSVSPETRLLAAMKLWGDIKYFDPQVAQGGVDWDAAFMRAGPAILLATNRDAYARAVDEMLSSLDDPATQVRDTARASFARITVSAVGSTCVITIGRGTEQTAASLERDAAQAIHVASKCGEILFDLRDVQQYNSAGVDPAAVLFSSESIAPLLSGDVALPRERSRSYVGYPNEAGGYEGYSAQDTTSDAVFIHGTSKSARRLAFFVARTTAVPEIAIALALTQNAAIYSIDGQPTAVWTYPASIDLPYGLRATYRTVDLADIAFRQQFASATVSGLPEAIAKLQSQGPPSATFASPPLERLRDDSYSDRRFPDEPMRMLAVSRVYNVIRYFSPYTALMHDDWDAAARAAIRDERDATEARLYLLGLLRFYAHLHDSHGGYVGGDLVAAEFGFGPPLEARYLHGQVVITQVLAADALLHGLKVGDIVDAVNGVPIRKAMSSIEAYICSSTPQAADHAALNAFGLPSVFSGRRGTTLTLRFHHPGSPSIATTFARGSFTTKPYRSGPIWTILPGNVGYVDFDRLKPSDVDAMFEALKHTRAIVFDNRGYPLGAAWPVAPRLTTATNVRLALFNTPLLLGPLDNPIDEAEPLPTYQEFYQMLDLANGPRYLKPTVMLIDERAISQSEHSALFFRQAGRTRFVGTPTRGANGDVTTMVVPGGLRLNFSGEGVRWPNGRQLQRVGVIPDVRVEPTAQDIAIRNDVVLQRGLDEALRLSGVSLHIRRTAVQQEITRENAAVILSGAP